ncbi:MAG: diguanylate cyclase [Clostridia bacterium]|nr:diguanylate cyclase [Clostridia bacterium]
MRRLHALPGDVSRLGHAIDLLRRLKDVAEGSGWVQVVCADIDGLARFNEEKGFASGNRAVGELAALMRDLAPSGSTYRFGGDEFYWLRVLPAPEPGGLVRLADRLRRDFAARMRRLGYDLTVSAGAYEVRAPTSAARLLGAPHHALSRAKEQGGNRLVDATVVDDVPESAYALVDDLIRRIDESVRAMETARAEAATDAISGLPNHRAGRAALERLASSAAAGGEPFALIFIDGDGLRAYNELGYEAGNRMIRDLAAVLRQGLRAHDVLARWLSGDEFLVLLPGSDVAAAVGVAERLRRSVEETTRSWPIPVTISAAVAACPAHGVSSDELLRRLYEAGHRAKQEGKNRVVVAEPPRAGEAPA